MVKKVLTWGTIAFLVFFIAYRPEPAAKVFRSVGGAVVDIFTGFGSFLSHLVS